MSDSNSNNLNPRPIVNVDTPALAGCVPRLDRATEVLPQTVGDSMGLDGACDRVDSGKTAQSIPTTIADDGDPNGQNDDENTPSEQKTSVSPEGPSAFDEFYWIRHRWGFSN